MMAGMLNAKMTRRLLATDKVRFVGEPVAVVVTEHPYQGEDAVELVDVDYDPLPAVVDFDDALVDEMHRCSRTPEPTSWSSSATRAA